MVSGIKVDRSWASGVVAVLLAVTGAALVLQRNGLLPWVALGAGSLMFIKALARPGRLDLYVALGLAIAWSAAWALTLYLVLSTWERGEVVEVRVPTPAGTHLVRTWIVDHEGQSLLVYDSPPDIAQILLAGVTVEVQRNGQVTAQEPVVQTSEELPPEQEALMYSLLGEKYGDLNGATDLFYGVLGGLRDRQLLLLRFREIGQP